MELKMTEVANRLKVPLETIHRWIRQGKIPVYSSRGDYFIHQGILERWAAEHNLKVFTPQDSEKTIFSSDLLAAVKRGGVFYGVPGGDKAAVLQAAVERIPNVGPADRPIVLAKLLEREQMASTGIGHGIALPHPRATLHVPLDSAQVTVCFLARPVDYEAIDGVPVSVLLVLLCTSTEEHLDLLSRIAFSLRDANFRNKLNDLPQPQELFDMIAGMEALQCPKT